MKDLKYSYEALQKFCGENGIELCKDYSKEIVKRETKIEGKCTTNGCNSLFLKCFRDLLDHNRTYCQQCLNNITILRRKQTCFEKYGVEHAINSNIVKNLPPLYRR